MQANLYTDQKAAPLLNVAVQCADDIALPTCFDLSAQAQQVFELARQGGYADDFLSHVHADGASNIDLCIRLVGVEEGEQLNTDWRGKPAPTNVLSFTADMVAGDHAILGDLVFCVDVVEHEASAQAKTLGDHYCHLLVHGLLHLLGYDHESESEAEVMETMEVTLLHELGIANPYE